MKSVIRVVGGTTALVFVPVRKKAKVQYVEAVVTTLDLAGDTMVMQFIRSGDVIGSVIRNTINIASCSWRCSLNGNQGGTEILTDTVVATGVANYYSPTERSDPLPDVLLVQPVTVLVVCLSSGVCQNLAVDYQLDDNL